MAEPALRALAVVCRLRHVETDAARRALADALADEAALDEADEAVQRRIAAERQFGGDFDHDAFAAWLGLMRARRDGLADASRAARARTEAARTALAARRMAETAAEESRAKAVAAVQEERARGDQAMLEEAARAIGSMLSAEKLG